MLNTDGFRMLSGSPWNESARTNRLRKHTDVEPALTIRLRKHTKVDNGDANSIIRFLAHKSDEEIFLYRDAQWDDNGSLMNFFFRDYQCLVDYEFFGDVLSVDATTYRININDVICVPFVGVNHHRERVMFGLGFLSDETTESFEWLLETFLRSMDKKEPQVIFSDQCQALMDGIENTFQTASHRINQNAPSHLSSLNGNDEFKKMWHHCMNGCETEDEFENSWQVMIESCGLSSDRWFSNTYSLRRKWASVFTNDRFSAGLHATLHSKTLKGLCWSSYSLYKFVLGCQHLQESWRSKKAEEDTSMAEQLIKDNHLLMHAAQIYTSNVYKIFVDMIQHPDLNTSGEDLEFKVVSSDTQSSIRARQVIFSRGTHRATCTCRMWETEGVLCRHILKIYYLMNVKRLPEQYIVKRWTRLAKVKDRKESYRDMAPDVWVKFMMREYYDVFMSFGSKLDKPEVRSFIEKWIQRLAEDVNNALKAKKMTSKATTPSPVQGFVDGQTESQSEMEKMDLSLQLSLNQSFFDGQDCDFQASQKTRSFPNAQCDTPGYSGVKGKGKRTLELFDEDFV